MKEALQYASDDVSREMPTAALGEVLLMANDHMHFEQDTTAGDTLDRFVMLASTFLQLREGVAGSPRHKILRSYQMIKGSAELAGARPFFDLFSLFRLATGVDLMDYQALMFGAISRFANFDTAKYLSDPGSYGLDVHWFSSTKMTPEIAERFLELIAGTPPEFTDSLKGNTGPNDFTAFRDRPMLRASPKLDLIDFSMLAEKFESGPFWHIHSGLNSKQREAFHSFWGKLFERYVGELFSNAADGRRNRVYVAPLFAGTNEELADIVILCGQDVVLIEAKGTTFRAEAKYEGNYTKLRHALESKLVESNDRPQAVKQLAKNIERAFGAAREPVNGLDLKYTGTVFPVVVTRDDLGGVPGVNAFLDLRFGELLNRKTILKSIAPLTCMSSELAEAISAYLGDTTLVEILEAQIAANRRGQTRYQTMPLFAAHNTVLAKKGERTIPNQTRNFEELVDLCINRLGLSPAGQ